MSPGLFESLELLGRDRSLQRLRAAADMKDGAGHTVLVVDDDPALRMLCRVNLELDGYTVLEAGSVDDAAASATAPPTWTSSCSTCGWAPAWGTG